MSPKLGSSPLKGFLGKVVTAMCRLWLTLALVVLPALMVKAEMPVFNDLPNTNIPQNLLKQTATPQRPASRPFELRYGFSRVEFVSSGREVKIDHQAAAGSSGNFFMIKTAEASSQDSDINISDFQKVLNSVNEVGSLNGLQPFLSQGYFKLLQDKVAAGASQYTVLAMMQVMRPSDIYILDYQVTNETAEVAVKGRSHFGPMQGLIHLVKQDGAWKIDRENWYASDTRLREPAIVTISRLSMIDKYIGPRSTGIIAQISPDSRLNMNYLSLTKVPYHKSGRAFTFVFLMKKDKINPHASKDVYEKVPNGPHKFIPRTHMHILWTGSKKLMREQRVMDTKYPLDVTVANYDDGYSQGQWNLILPNKKPREVVVSWLWNF